MTRELVITAPTAEAAIEAVRRLRPGATIRTVADTGPAAQGDLAQFHRLAKRLTQRRPGEIQQFSLKENRHE